jgi:membrane protease YdiL (CAAX protease family)
MRARLFPVAAGFYLVVAVAGLVGLGLERGTLGGALWLDPGGWWLDLALGIALGAALLGAWALGTRFAAGARRVEAELTAVVAELTAGEALALALISALAEEVAFRGALQGWLGWLPATLLFGLAHLGPGRHFRWWTAWALAAGALLGALVAVRGNLGGAVVAHLVVNGVQLTRMRGAPRRSVPENPGGAPPA